MQNKPNFRKSQMNVSNIITKDYENKTLGERGKNKPNSNPIQSQYKAKTNPIQSQFKPNTCPPRRSAGLIHHQCGGTEAKNAALQLFAVGCRTQIIMLFKSLSWKWSVKGYTCNVP